MSKFKIARRTAAFTNLNIRGENHGKKKIPAVDLSVHFTGPGTGKDNLLDMLIPVRDDADNKASEFFFTEDGYLRAPTMNPIVINRSPEGLVFSVFDKKEPMVFRDGRATGFVIEFQEGGTIKVSCKLQGIPDDGYTERLKKIVFGSIELAIESEQEDLFSMPPPKKKDEEGEQTTEEKNQGDAIQEAMAAEKGRKGGGRNQGLRLSEVKTEEGKSESSQTTEKAGKQAAKKKKKAKSGGARGRRLNS